MFNYYTLYVIFVKLAQYLLFFSKKNQRMRRFQSTIRYIYGVKLKYLCTETLCR